MTPMQNNPAGEGEEGSSGSSGFAEPPHVPRTASADSYQRTGAANNNTQQPEFESNFRPLSIWKSSPSSAESQLSKQKLRHIPIDISPYIALSCNHSTTNPRLAERRPSLPEIYARQDKDEGSIRLRVKRHVPIVIPAFAHPFVNDLTKKPPFQPTVQAWPPAPKLRREVRQLPSSDDAAAKLPVSSINDLNTMRMSLLNGTADKMNISQTNQPTPEMTRHAQDAPPESATPQSGQPGVASSMSQQVDGAGPTNLSGLVCNVHRTSGREPHALVGATTTILGDKL